MKVRALKQCDSSSGKALFEHQVYDLPDDEGRLLIKVGDAESVEAKAVEGPPQDKSVAAPSRTKRGRRRKADE